MTIETFPLVHYPECNDRCDGDSHYLLGDGDAIEKSPEDNGQAETHEGEPE